MVASYGKREAHANAKVGATVVVYGKRISFSDNRDKHASHFKMYTTSLDATREYS
jgi:hypothetical protein